MLQNDKLIHILRVIYDENLNIGNEPSIISAIVSKEDPHKYFQNDINQLNEIMIDKKIDNLDRTTTNKFPIETTARRMLSLDNNCETFQSNLATIFGIKTKPQPKPKKPLNELVVTKAGECNLTEKYPNKRTLESIENIVENIDNVKFKSEFKTASGKHWEPEKNDNSTISKSNISGGTTTAVRRNLGLSKINTTTSQNSRFTPSNTIKKDDKQQLSADLPEIKGIEPRMVELILNEILDKSALVDWDDVAGLEFAKNTIKEIIIWPMLRPDIFTGLRGPPKGVLLFGPPGTGKTLIGKCIASKSKATFFSISASSLTSKWVGEGEKMVRSLFAVAKHFQPAVIFIDEIDSLLTQRCDGEHESSRRIKTEFLVQLDGCGCFDEERVLVIGATNRPQELDEAARRRLVKKLYIPLPNPPARKQIIGNLLRGQNHNICDEDLDIVVIKTEGYSGADVTNLCKEAAISPLRSLMADISTLDINDVPPITLKDFEIALKLVKSSVSPNDLNVYSSWNEMYGNMTL